jgi:hypothetical protein
VLGSHGPALDEAGDEDALLEVQMNDLRPDAEPGGQRAGLHLALAIDAEQLGPLSGEADDEHRPVHLYPVVGIRDAAGQGLRAGRHSRPDVRNDLTDRPPHDVTVARGGFPHSA